MKDVRIDLTAAGATVIKRDRDIAGSGYDETLIARLTKDEAAEVYAVIEAAKKRQATEDLRKERDSLTARLLEINMKLAAEPQKGRLESAFLMRPTPAPGSAADVPPFGSGSGHVSESTT